MTDSLIHSYPVRIRPLVLDAARGLPEGLENPFTFQIEASNNNLDFYFTHMSERTLRNFAQDATDRVQFLDSHNSRNLGYGRTFAGRVEEDTTRQPTFVPLRGSLGTAELAIAPPASYMRSLVDVYTVPGVKFGGMLTYASTDDFITAVNARLTEDVSVGFYGGEHICDICGGHYDRYDDCRHYAGYAYGTGESGERQVLCTVTIDGAHLAEISAVYDGATPNATILKAQEAARAGKLDSADKRFLEVRYQVDFPGRSSWQGVDLSERRDAPAQSTQEQVSMELKQIAEEARGVLAVQTDDEIPQAVRSLIEENGRLRPLADEGRTYRADLTAAALAEGVRAYGSEFNQEQYRSVLERSSLEEIKLMSADWQRIGNGRLTGGRKTRDGSEEPEKEKAERRHLYPDSAYQ